MCKAINATSLEVFHCTAEKELAQPLKARDYKDPLVVIYELSEDKMVHRERADTANSVTEQSGYAELYARSASDIDYRGEY